MKPLLMIGYFPETIELCERIGYTIVGIVDSEAPASKYRYIGNDEAVLKNAEQYRKTPACIVPDQPVVRKKLYQSYTERGFHIETIISERAFISASATIGEGCVIQDGCNVGANVNLGKCVRINTFGNVMHDSTIGNFVTVAPNAVVLGRCSIGDEWYIGANSTILPDVKINSAGGIVGAGAVVTKRIDARMTVAGVPARELK